MCLSSALPVLTLNLPPSCHWVLFIVLPWSLPLPHLVPDFTQPGQGHQPGLPESQVVPFQASCLIWQGLPLLWPSPFLPVRRGFANFPLQIKRILNIEAPGPKKSESCPLHLLINSKNLSHNALGQEISPRAPLVNHNVLFAARLTVDHFDAL